MSEDNPLSSSSQAPQSRTLDRFKGPAILTAKLLVTVLLFWSIASFVDFSALSEYFVNVGWFAVLAAILAGVAQILIASVRLSLVAKHNEVDCPLPVSIRVVFLGTFFSQGFATFVSGDAVRLWRLVSLGATVRNAARIVLLDRVVGLLAIISLMILGMPTLVPMADQPATQTGFLLLSLAGIGGIIVFLALGVFVPERLHTLPRIAGFVADMSSASRILLRSPKLFLQVFVLSIGIHLASVLIFYFLVIGYSIDVGWLELLVVIPTVLFLSMLPISIGGWGVREGSLVVALGMFGVQSDGALALSITFGFVLILTSLPGGFLWFFRDKPSGSDHSSN